MTDVDDEDNLPLRVEGWLNVWEVDGEDEKMLFGDGQMPVPFWEPTFCVLLQDMGKFTLHGSEQIADERVCYKRRQRLRLDGGKAEFDKRWGYETLHSIKENAMQHCSQQDHHPQHESETDTDSIICKTFGLSPVNDNNSSCTAKGRAMIASGRLPSNVSQSEIVNSF